MSTSKIELQGDTFKIDAGLILVDDLYEKAGITLAEKKCLYLDKDKDIDIPLLPGDYIIICGKERIFIGDLNPDIGKNPGIRIPVHPQFNDGRLKLDIGKAKITGRELRKSDTELSASKLFVDLSGQVDVLVKDEWVLVLQDSDCYFTIPASDDDAIDTEECAKTKRKPPKGQDKYRIKIDGKKYDVPLPEMTGEEILKLVNKSYAEWTLNQKFSSGRRKPIEEEHQVDFSCPGIERFETVKKQAQQGIAL